MEEMMTLDKLMAELEAIRHKHGGNITVLVNRPAGRYTTDHSIDTVEVYVFSDKPGRYVSINI